MAICIDYPVHEDAIYDGEIKVKDFAILGFKSIIKDITGLLYYFSDENDVVYMVQNSFSVNDEDKLFLEAPINHLLNIDKMPDRDKETFNTIVNDMAANNCYYTSFDVIKLGDKLATATCRCTHTINDEHHYVDLILPMSIFIRVQIMKNRMIFDIPMNAFLDQDEKFNELRLHRGCDVEYFGCDASGKEVIIALYVLEDGVGRKIGLASAVPSPKKIITTKIVEKEKFSKLYPNSYIINMTKIIIIDWLDDNDNPCKKICVYIVNDNNVSVYMMNGKPADNILMKPYKMIFPEGLL